MDALAAKMADNISAIRANNEEIRKLTDLNKTVGGTPELEARVQALEIGVGEIWEGIGEIREALGKVRESFVEVRQTFVEVQQGIGRVWEGVGDIREGSGGIREGLGGIREEIKETAAVTQTLADRPVLGAQEIAELRGVLQQYIDFFQSPVKKEMH